MSKQTVLMSLIDPCVVLGWEHGGCRQYLDPRVFGSVQIHHLSRVVCMVWWSKVQFIPGFSLQITLLSWFMKKIFSWVMGWTFFSLSLSLYHSLTHLYTHTPTHTHPYSCLCLICWQAALESILSGAICGVIYSLFAGQPLTILGSTGPVLVFESILNHFCK